MKQPEDTRTLELPLPVSSVAKDERVACSERPVKPPSADGGRPHTARSSLASFHCMPCGFLDLVAADVTRCPFCDRPKGRQLIEATRRVRGRKRGEKIGAYVNAGKGTNARTRCLTGLSQADFAYLAGISERTLRNWEAGTTHTNIDVLAAIMRTLAKHGVDYWTAAARPHRRPDATQQAR